MTIKSHSLITATLLLTTQTYADEILETITVISTNKTVGLALLVLGLISMYTGTKQKPKTKSKTTSKKKKKK